MFVCSFGVCRDTEAQGGDNTVDTAAESTPAAAAEAAEDSEVVAAPAESRTVQLSKRVEAEGKMADARAQRMANLNSELKRQVFKPPR